MITHLGGQDAGPVTVAVADPFFRALLVLCTEEGAEIQLDRLLHTACGQLGDQLPNGAAIE